MLKLSDNLYFCINKVITIGNTWRFLKTSNFYLYNDFNEMLKISFWGSKWDLKWIIHLHEYIPIFML